MNAGFTVRLDKEKDRVVPLEKEDPDHAFFRISPELFKIFGDAGTGLSLKVTSVELYEEWVRVYSAGQIILVSHQGSPVIGLSKDAC